jgi:hypothetical protein
LKIEKGFIFPPNPLGSIPLPAQSSYSSFSSVNSSAPPTPACHQAHVVSAHFFLPASIAPAQPLHCFPPFLSLARSPSRPTSSPGPASPSSQDSRTKKWKQNSPSSCSSWRPLWIPTKKRLKMWLKIDTGSTPCCTWKGTKTHIYSSPDDLHYELSPSQC